MAAKFFGLDLKRKIIGTPIDENPLPEEDNLDKILNLGLQIDPEIRQTGEELFDQFCDSQIRMNGDVKPDIMKLIMSSRALSPSPETNLTETASRLCEMAANFAKSEERQRIKETATMIGKDLNKNDLAALLLSMVKEMQHKEEGVVVLFYFCYDLAMTMIELNYGTYLEILSLCKSGIVQALGPQIQANGGWANVVTKAAQITTMLGTAAMAMLNVGVSTFFSS